MTCGKGTRMRYVSCRDDQGSVADEAACFHLPKPSATEVCSVTPCGQWKALEWSSVSKSSSYHSIIYMACSCNLCHIFLMYSVIQCTSEVKGKEVEMFQLLFISKWFHFKKHLSRLEMKVSSFPLVNAVFSDVRPR